MMVVAVRTRPVSIDRPARYLCRWTSKEDEYLSDWWGIQMDITVAQKLHRTVGACISRAKIRGLQRKQNYYTIPMVAEILNMHVSSVHRLLTWGWLHGVHGCATGAARCWRISERAIVDFLMGCPHQYDYRRITYPYWRGIAKHASMADPWILVREAAQVLGCSPRHILYLCMTERLPHVNGWPGNRGRQAFRIHLASLRWYQSRGQSATGLRRAA